MRISESMRMDSIERSTAGLRERLDAASKVASSGIRVGAPSDDPMGAAQMVRLKASLDQTASYRATIQSGRGDLELGESTLASAGDLLQRANEIALQASNGALNATDRITLSEEVKQISDQLFSWANAKGDNGYLFAGSLTGTPPFVKGAVVVPTPTLPSLDSVVYVGDTNVPGVEISSSVKMAVGMSGSAVFGNATTVATTTPLTYNTPTSGVFVNLNTLYHSLAAGNAPSQATVNALDASHRQIADARADYGLKLARLDISDAAHEQASLSLTTQRAAISDANPVEAYSQLTALTTALQQAMSVARTTLQTMQSQNLG
jgi:flagellar hook-associated protein 3 FlgL